MVNGQKLIRSFLAIQQARIQVLLKYSEKLEPQWKLSLKKQKETNKSAETMNEEKKGKLVKKVTVKKKKEEGAAAVVISELDHFLILNDYYSPFYK